MTSPYGQSLASRRMSQNAESMPGSVPRPLPRREFDFTARFSPQNPIASTETREAEKLAKRATIKEKLADVVGTRAAIGNVAPIIADNYFDQHAYGTDYGKQPFGRHVYEKQVSDKPKRPQKKVKAKPDQNPERKQTSKQKKESVKPTKKRVLPPTELSPPPIVGSVTVHTDTSNTNGANISTSVGNVTYEAPTCCCPGRYLEVSNIPKTCERRVVELAFRAGELEFEPRVQLQQVVVQFVDTRHGQQFTELVAADTLLAAAVVHHVVNDAMEAVAVDVPWGVTLGSKELYNLMSMHGQLTHMKVKSNHSSFQQQVLCTFADIRDTYKLVNAAINCGDMCLQPYLVTIPHSALCDALLSTTQPSQILRKYLPQQSPQHSPQPTLPLSLQTSNLSVPHTNLLFSNLSISDRYQSKGLSSLNDGISSFSSGFNGLSNGRPSILSSCLANGCPIGITSGLSGVGSCGTSKRLPNVLTSGLSDVHPTILTNNLDSLNSNSLSSLNSCSLNSNSMAGLRGCHDFFSSELMSPASTVEKTTDKKLSPDCDVRSFELDCRKDPMVTYIDLDAIICGQEKRTTVMVCNIPNKLEFDDFKKFIDETSYGTYDFLYLRFDFSNRCNVGYAFVSFISPLHVKHFVASRRGMKWNSQKSYNSEKVIDIKIARIQGRDSLIRKFRNSPVMNQEPAFRPRLYHASGELAGQEMPFPV